MKTFNCFGIEMDLTDEARRKVTSALVETQGKLDRELRYPEDLQKPEMVAFYRQHITKLEGILAD